MYKIDWKRKLGSRKFWAFLAAFISAILYVFKVAESDITQIMGVVTAFGSMVIYVLTEGKVDVEYAKNSISPIEKDQEKEV